MKVFQGLARDSPLVGEVPSGDRVTCGSDQHTKCGREILMSSFVSHWLVITSSFVCPGLDAVNGSYQIYHDSGLQGWISSQEIAEPWLNRIENNLWDARCFRNAA